MDSPDSVSRMVVGRILSVVVALIVFSRMEAGVIVGFVGE